MSPSSEENRRFYIDKPWTDTSQYSPVKTGYVPKQIFEWRHLRRNKSLPPSTSSAATDSLLRVVNCSVASTFTTHTSAAAVTVSTDWRTGRWKLGSAESKKNLTSCNPPPVLCFSVSIWIAHFVTHFFFSLLLLKLKFKWWVVRAKYPFVLFDSNFVMQRVSIEWDYPEQCYYTIWLNSAKWIWISTSDVNSALKPSSIVLLFTGITSSLVSFFSLL